MIAKGAVYSNWGFTSYNESAKIMTTEISESPDGNNKRLSISRWRAFCFIGRQELEARVKDFSSSQQARNLWWEQEPKLRWEDGSSWNYLIIRIQSSTDMEIQKGFVKVARHLGICHHDDVASDSYHSSLVSKVYTHISKELNLKSAHGYHYTPLLVFDGFKPQGKDS